MPSFLTRACYLLFIFTLLDAHLSCTSASDWKVRKIEVGGEGGWDYLTVDAEANRLYVSRGNRVVVLDLTNDRVVGELPDTPGVHGIALVPELGKGYTTNGGDATVTVFDINTLKKLGTIEARGVPDAVLYDAFSKQVFTFNHKTDDATVIDTRSDTVKGTIAFESEPEAAVADGQGRVFVNLRTTSEIGEIDAMTLKVINRWPLAPGVRPNGLGIDLKNRRLFSTCGNQKMVVMDADKGTILGTAEIGKGSDGCFFDPLKGLAYSSNGEGNVTVVREIEPGKFAAIETIPTQASARTMTIHPKTSRLYLSAATVMPPPEGTPAPQGGRRNMVPGSFVIIELSDSLSKR